MMSRLIILGATGSLGSHVLRQALAVGHEVTVFVRTPSKLPPEDRGRVSVHTGDLSAHAPLDLIRGQDGLINCAGYIADGDAFVGLIDRLVTGVDSLPGSGAAGLLVSGGRSAPRYWRVRPPRRRPAEGEVHLLPHRVNFERLRRSRLDWGMQCPGPMVDDPALGLDRLRISLDALPVQVPAFARALPVPLLLPVFGSLIPQMIVSSADAAASCSPTSIAAALRRAIVSGWRCPRACGDGSRGGRPRSIPQHSRASSVSLLRTGRHQQPCSREPGGGVPVQSAQR